MRSEFGEKLEAARIREGYYKSLPGDRFGGFRFMGPCGRELIIIAADASDDGAKGWEHVSVSTRTRPPNWQEMCLVKDLFFTEDECVVQFHPPRSAHINNNRHCLHIWKPPYAALLPPPWLIGDKDVGVVETHTQADALIKSALNALQRATMHGDDQ